MDTLILHNDPVCGKEVAADRSSEQSEFEGSIYYFCSRGCREKFERDLGLYIEKLRIQNSNA